MRLTINIFISAVILVALLVVLARFYFSNMTQPSQIGMGIIQPCPNTPNCVSTQATNKANKIQQVPLVDGDPIVTLDAIEKIVQTMPRSTMVTRNEHYMHVEFRSLIWNFVDDVEFFANIENGTVDSRSAARMGYSDLGANRARFNKIIDQLQSD